MSIIKKLSVLAVVVFALSAIGVANASAESTFTASETGEITGKGLETQKFKTIAGTVECPAADMKISGAISEKASKDQHVTIKYGNNCKAFGFPVDISAEVTYTFTANKKVHTKSSITLTVTGGIFGECTITVASGQELGTVSYDNNAGKIKVTPNVTGIHYVSSGGLCGSAGEHTDGTYTGAAEVERVGGGTISWDE